MVPRKAGRLNRGDLTFGVYTVIVEHDTIDVAVLVPRYYLITCVFDDRCLMIEVLGVGVRVRLELGTAHHNRSEVTTNLVLFFV